MVFTDKMEQLTVKWQGTTYHWQRLQQSNERVLPLQWQTPQDWEPAFGTWVKSILPKHNPTVKRRRIVLEEEEENNVSLAKTPALKVRIHHQDTSSPTPLQETSIRELKQQFGVNVTQLEASHEFVQAEEQQTRREGERIDQDRSVLSEDNAEERLELTKVRLQRSRQVLEHLLQTQAEDDDLLWNAREHVRQLAMDVGNQSLWYPARRQEFHLQQAHRMFQLAQTMVMQSQSSLSETEFFYQRVLCLVLGQAQTNRGIVLVEQQKYRAALQQLSTTTTVDPLLQMIQQHSKDESLLQHELQAWQLYSLTMRWRGVAHWHLHRREKAHSCWKDAATCLSKLQGAKQEDNEHYHALVQECIMACVVCADLFRQALHQELGNRKESTTILQSYYETAHSALREAVGLAQSLQAQNCSMTDEDEANVYNAATLQEAATELEQWWKTRQEAQQVTLATADLPVRLERSDVTLAPPPPTRRLVWNPQSSSGQRRRKKLPPDGNFDNATMNMEEERHTAANTRIPELPWGDALFPRNARGQPILPTYCGPPPMDPEMAVLAQRLGIVIPHFQTMKERS
jgi:tetratricopeptide (TPR) repeat protein